MDCASFISLHRQLLADERAAEVDQSEQLLGGCSVGQLCRRGVCLSRLALLERRTGLYGRSVLTLGPPSSGTADATLPPGHSFRPGDIVQLASAAAVPYSADSSAVQAVVTAVSSRKLVLTLDGDDFDADQDDCTLFRVIKVASDITYRRLIGALDSLEQRCSSSSTLRRVLFGELPVPIPCPTLPPRLLDSSGELRWCNPTLDASQRAAVLFAVQQPTLAVIHGPPGTGKTTTVVEAIVQHVRLGSRVLVCAPSNTAVDNLLLRLSAAAELGAVSSSAALLRLGHPARIDAALQRFSLDAHVQTAPEANIVLDVRDDLDAVLRRSRGRARAVELSQLRAELRQRELRLTRDVLRRARVVLSTLTSVSADGPLRQLPDDHFQLVVIDECSQALEAACWLAVPRAGKLLLSGDHQQLPPTIMSASAARRGLSVSLMERCVQRLGDAVVRLLSTQYRMHELIQRWSSRTFYSGQLQASPTVATHRLCDLPSVCATDDTTCPLLLIDTCGCDLWEMKQQPDGADVAGSCGNEGEADIIVSHVRSLLSAGLSAAHVGVITPYSMQVGLIGARLRSAGFGAVEVNSVDGYQGREKEAIVVSMVRCNRRGEIGFLSERRRINVAVTRARRQLTVVCDTVTVGHDEVIRSLLDHMTECGEVRSAAAYDADIGPVSALPAVSNNSTDKPAKTATKSRPGASSKQKTGRKRDTDKEVRTGFNGSIKSVATPATHPSLDGDSGDCDQRIESLRNQLEAFQMGNRYEMGFSTDLSSFERMKVHEMADELGLIHGSCGEGRGRRVVVGKQESLAAESPMAELPAALGITAHNSDNVQTDVASPVADESSGGTTAVEDSVLSTPCAVCGKTIPAPNLELHKLRCRALASNPPREPAAVKSKSAGQKKNARKKKRRCAAEKDSDDEDEALLSSLTAMNSRCNATTGGAACRSTSTTLLQTCAHCRLVYCLQHHMAEEHGCGTAARTAARREFSCRSAMRAAAAASHSQQTRHGQLQRALTAKLTQMEGKRQPQASGNK